jgi:hypothetical protein
MRYVDQERGLSLPFHSTPVLRKTTGKSSSWLRPACKGLRHLDRHKQPPSSNQGTITARSDILFGTLPARRAHHGHTMRRVTFAIASIVLGVGIVLASCELFAIEWLSGPRPRSCPCRRERKASDSLRDGPNRRTCQRRSKNASAGRSKSASRLMA